MDLLPFRRASTRPTLLEAITAILARYGQPQSMEQKTARTLFTNEPQVSITFVWHAEGMTYLSFTAPDVEHLAVKIVAFLEAR